MKENFPTTFSSRSTVSISILTSYFLKSSHAVYIELIMLLQTWTFW